jgi:cyclopropane-fatty-acyl-phospholipid synthase
LPDAALRAGIRGQLRARLRQQRRTAAGGALEAMVDELRRGPIATHTADANRQHYEVPTEFYHLVLGPRRKYSSGLWLRPDDDLTSSELAMLELYVARARITGGERILDLGCGWGSLSLFLAERFPHAEIVALSNSRTQKGHIDTRCAERGIDNVEVVTADINDFVPSGDFDRVLSIEMFEHMSNYRDLLRRIAGWLRPDGLLFVHHFAHREHAYPFDAGAANQWMARHFFSGGIMPSADLLERFPEHMSVARRWNVDGRHYQRTCEAWLARMTLRRDDVMRVLTEAYGAAEARKHYNYWRIFFMACAELFGYREGTEWFVVHALLTPRATARGGGATTG